MKEDDLCRLRDEEKLRICAAVFNTKYFEDKVTLSNAIRNVVRCRKRTVSFQRKYEKTTAVKCRFREWMLNCKPKIDKFSYFLSHAYASDQIFVYFRNDDTGYIFLENVTTNVRITFSSETTSTI